MRQSSGLSLVGLGVSIFLGLAALGYLLGQAAVEVKEYERSVTAKGLSEREFPADVVIWPVTFTVAGNDLARVYAELDTTSQRVRSFLERAGIGNSEITLSAPNLTDKSAQAWGDAQHAEFRYVASRNVTVYSSQVDTVRAAMDGLIELGKEGVAFTGNENQNKVEYLFTHLNDVKPEMIEEATRNARDVAQKFAEDSESRLGKIRRASQGQFSITARDTNNPHIKKVRVVSTVEYYLSD